MPYLDGREPVQPITSFGKPRLTTSDFMFKKWAPKAPLPKDKLKFGLTHPDKVCSQVREKPSRDGFAIKMSNIWKQKDAVPLKTGISSWGKSSPNDGRWPGNGTQFHTQSPQIQTRNGSTMGQLKKDGRL